VFGTKVDFKTLEDLPFIPVSAFKTHQLMSINEGDIFKVLTSSGTTGQSVSRIYLDKDTARLQSVALSKIISFSGLRIYYTLMFMTFLFITMFRNLRLRVRND
jgi:phenylacetate-coenzyme A ligase PaaK-like adenylate-forming protein